MRKLLKYTLPIVAIVAVLFIIQDYFKPEVIEEQKTVTLTFSIVEEDGTQQLEQIDVGSIKEDELLTLGDVIDKVNRDHDHINFKLSGSKDSEFGRYIEGINEYLTEDISTGPWWFYNSETNEVCIAAGFCDGIDTQPVYDEDIFDFEFTR